MPQPRKTRDLWEIQQNWGFGQPETPARMTKRRELTPKARTERAAPALLAALERAASWLEELPYPNGRDALAQARAAIAQAKGETTP